MWSSEKNRRLGSSSSSSSKSNYSSSSSSSMMQQRTMAEVWKEIAFPAENRHHVVHRPHPVILQDFLAGPIKENPVAHPPPPVLTLRSGMEFEYVLEGSAVQPIIARSNAATSNSDANSENPHMGFMPDGVIASPPPSTGLFCFCPQKRALESSEADAGDIRHKRMIKNRESAARSRARKQAYANELELEVIHLVEENSRLKKQYEELRLAMAAQAHTKKVLQRTSTAPF